MRRRRNSLPACIEKLERRDCPAVIGVEGSLALEENGGPVTLTVRLSEAQRTPVEVRFLSFGSAKAGADYHISSGGRPLSSFGTLTFRPGQTAIPITVSPINDIAREGTESVTFQLVSARGHILADRLATLTFQDDDNYTATLLGPTQITPGQSATYTIQLSSPATKNEVFYVSTRDGSATSKDNDYWPITDLPVTVTAGQSATSFTLPGSKPNTEPEFDEFYRLTVRTRSANFPTISDVGVVIPGIGPEPAPTISIGNASGNEGNTGAQALAFDVMLSKAYSQTVTVDYATADGTATVADTDYTAASGRLTFLPGETRKTVAVSVTGDTKPEQTETFTIVLSAPTNATVANGTGVGSIINDDGQDGFQIIVNPIGNVDSRVLTAIGRAVAKWQQVITGDVPSYVNPYNGQLVDDIVLDVRMGLLGTAFPTGTDGSAGSNLIANAGPLYGGAPGVNGQLAIRPSPRLPYWGTIGFDPANVASDSAESLYTTALHEIGHALGFGNPLFEQNGLVVNVGGAWIYRGANAVAAYNQIFQRNAVDIRMESDTGSAGTDRVHWDDLAVPGELMNGFLTIGAPLSRITVGAMQDLGYQVNPAAADVYPRSVTAIASRTTTARTAQSTAPRFRQSPLSLAFALYQQLAEAKPSDGTASRGTIQRR